ncbi:MAG: hypothetical protein ABSC21_12035 [Terriglobia bacterium]|jgi:hypothetical protein
MSKAEVAKNQPDDGDERTLVPTPSLPKREISQVTLSTLGDISMAATDSVGRAADAPRATRWFPILGFFLLMYVATCLVTLFSFKRDPWVRAFLTPLFPVLIATAAFWWRQRWKFRAKGERFKLKVWQNALGSLSHEATSAANAIRANLAGFRLANPQAAPSELLSAIAHATARIDKALQKSNGLLTLKGKAN